MQKGGWGGYSIAFQTRTPLEFQRPRSVKLRMSGGALRFQLQTITRLIPKRPRDCNRQACMYNYTQELRMGKAWLAAPAACTPYASTADVWQHHFPPG
eukprot:7418002-Alexandrium_andersonii.AAC.1